MEEPLDDKIKRLKAELNVAKQAHQLWDILLEKREKLEEKIAALKDEIEEKQSAKYHADKNTYEETQSKDNQKAALETIKQNKQAIDEKLDDYEDFSDDIVNYLHHQLVITILNKHPDQEDSYRNLDKQLQQSTNLSEKLQSLTVSTKDIDRLIDKIYEERQRAGPFRLLQFFLGDNPYVAITQSIKGIKLLCGNALDLLHDIEESVHSNRDAKDLLEQLNEIFVGLQTFAQQRWNNSKIDKLLVPYKGMLGSFVTQLEDFKKATDDNIVSQKEMISLWIEQHT